jgi:2-dehydro-3-deoxyphosphogluconate aldolase/(4S)-4-hydroxy-2-oxoglutarate aldolase
LDYVHRIVLPWTRVAELVSDAEAGPLQTLARLRILPVVVIDDPGRAAALGLALEQGGLPVAEITLRTPDALQALRELARVPAMTVGVGSVVRPAQVGEAVNAGAAFVVTPGLSRAVIDECRACGISAVPGVTTPTEILAALDQGVSTLKFFPAEQAGGVHALSAFAGPFPDVRFVPTGGLHPGNVLSYLALPTVLAAGGSWMVPRSAIARQDFDTISDLAADARAAAVAAAATEALTE